MEILLFLPVHRDFGFAHFYRFFVTHAIPFLVGSLVRIMHQPSATKCLEYGLFSLAKTPAETCPIGALW